MRTKIEIELKGIYIYTYLMVLTLLQNNNKKNNAYHNYSSRKNTQMHCNIIFKSIFFLLEFKIQTRTEKRGQFLVLSLLPEHEQVNLKLHRKHTQITPN